MPTSANLRLGDGTMIRPVESETANIGRGSRSKVSEKPQGNTPTSWKTLPYGDRQKPDSIIGGNILLCHLDKRQPADAEFITNVWLGNKPSITGSLQKLYHYGEMVYLTPQHYATWQITCGTGRNVDEEIPQSRCFWRTRHVWSCITQHYSCQYNTTITEIDPSKLNSIFLEYFQLQ